MRSGCSICSIQSKPLVTSLGCRVTPGHCWIVSAQAKAPVVLACTNGVLPPLHSVNAEISRPWSTSSTRAQLQSWKAACWASMKQTTMPSTGWRLRRQRHSRNNTRLLTVTLPAAFTESTIFVRLNHAMQCNEYYLQVATTSNAHHYYGNLTILNHITEHLSQTVIKQLDSIKAARQLCKYPTAIWPAFCPNIIITIASEPLIEA